MAQFIHIKDMGCELLEYLNYSVYFYTVSFWTVPSPTSNTERHDVFNNRFVEHGYECFTYLKVKLTQFPEKIELFFLL